MTGIKYLNFVADIFGVAVGPERRGDPTIMPTRFELTDDLCTADRRVFPRNEAEACRYRGMAPFTVS